MRVLMLLFKDIHYDARVKREAAALAQAGHEVVIACLEEFSEPPPVVAEGVTIWRYKISTKRLKRKVTGQEQTPALTPSSSSLPDQDSINQQVQNEGRQVQNEGRQVQNEGRMVPFASLILRLVRFPLLKLAKDGLASMEYYRSIVKDLRRYRVDVIHCHDLNTLPAGVRLARRFKTKLVYDSHELFNEMAGKNWLEKRIGYLVEGLLMPHIDHLIVVNSHVHQLFNKRYGPYPTTVVQNVPEAPDWRQTPPQEVLNLRQHFGLSADDLLLLYQGGLNPERGLEECIQAVAMLPETFKLILIGDGRLKEALKEQVNHLHLGDRVFFLGQVPSEQLLWYTCQADVGLVVYKNTSLNNYYSTPNKIFEYLLAGLPTIASDHPGKRLVAEEGTGICIEETPEAIKDGILDIVTQLEMYRERCREMRSRYSWQAEQKKLIRVYRQLEALGDEQALNH